MPQGDLMDRRRDKFGVKPNCSVLQIATSCFRWHVARQRNPQVQCVRAQRDRVLIQVVQSVWHAHWQVYGAGKLWKQIKREGIRIAPCTVERLMGKLGLKGLSPVNTG